MGQHAPACGITFTTRLMAGALHVGNVTVWNDEGRVYLHYQTHSGWRMQVSNGAVLGMPHVLPPDPNLYPLRKSHSTLATEHTFVIPFAADWVPMQAMLQVVAHAVVRHPSVPRQVHAWAEGVRLGPDTPPVVNTLRLQDCTREIIMISDAAVFTEGAMDEPGNQQLVWNSVALLYRGMRTGDRVWFDRGRGAACVADGGCSNDNLRTMRDLITGARSVPSEILQPLNFTVEDKFFAPGEMTHIPLDVRVIFLFAPPVDGAFSPGEIELLRRFVAEGGRLIYISDSGAAGDDAGVVSAASSWLERMGASARNQRIPVAEAAPLACAATSRLDAAHGFTNQVGRLNVSCASEIVALGARDVALVRDAGGAHVLGASVRTNTRATGAVATTRTPIF